MKQWIVLDERFVFSILVLDSSAGSSKGSMSCYFIVSPPQNSTELHGYLASTVCCLLEYDDSSWKMGSQIMQL